MRRLNLGCGTIKKKGYINIDINPEVNPDMVANCLKLPFSLNSCDEIISFHLIEHFTKEDGLRTLKHWHSLLKTGGKLIIECPDIEQIIKEFFVIPREFRNAPIYREGDRLPNIFGSQSSEYQVHKWGYYPAQMKRILSEIGFKEIKINQGTDYHQRECPCMRVEAIK